MKRSFFTSITLSLLMFSSLAAFSQGDYGIELVSTAMRVSVDAE